MKRNFQIRTSSIGLNQYIKPSLASIFRGFIRIWGKFLASLCRKMKLATPVIAGASKGVAVALVGPLHVKTLCHAITLMCAQQGSKNRE